MTNRQNSLRESHHLRGAQSSFVKTVACNTYSILGFSTMARRRKHRTHLKGGAASAPGTAEGVPKSFVIKHGQVGTALTTLVRDLRKVMEPNTASRLKVRPPLIGIFGPLTIYRNGTGIN